MAAQDKQTLSPAEWKRVSDHLIELSQRMSLATSRSGSEKTEQGKEGSLGSTKLSAD